MKIFEADQKRLKSILISYEEKKADLTEKEKKERNELINLLKECFLLFKISFNDQTNKFERLNGGFDFVVGSSSARQNEDISQTRIESQNISKINGDNNNETVMAFMEDRVVKSDYLDFDGILN